MENKLKALIFSLKGENDDISIKLNDVEMTQYNRSYYTHRYNHNLEFIKKLEAILN